MEMAGSAPLHILQPCYPETIEVAILDLGLGGWPLKSGCNWDWAPELAMAIQLGTTFAVRDGSYMPHRSTKHTTAAWIMQTEVESPKQCWGKCATSGMTQEVNAFRAELHGVHAMLLALKVLYQVYRITAGSISLACDNNNAVYHTNNGCLDVASSVKYVDLVRYLSPTKGVTNYSTNGGSDWAPRQQS
jgi:hypothetical protein